MDAKDAIRSSANISSMVLKSYVSDLEDADLMCRPREGCNHLAWQLGHLICSEVQLLGMIVPKCKRDLPAGFVEAHGKETCGSDVPTQFCSKELYVELFDQVRAATEAALQAFAAADLDLAAPEDFRDFCPKMGDMFTLIAIHPMMHAGQFATVRRRLGKRVLF